MEKKSSGESVIIGYAGGGAVGLLRGSKSVVTVEARSTTLFRVPDKEPQPFKKLGKDMPGIVSWGDNNRLPQELIEKIYLNPVTASGILFNIQMGYGNGIEYGYWEMNNNKKVWIPAYDEKIEEFFENNDIQGYLLEQLTDMVTFFNVFPELIFNADGNVITNIKSKEAAFSRWSELDKIKRRILFHYYSGKWHKTPDPETEIFATEVLDMNYPLEHLKVLCGQMPDVSFEKMDAKAFNYVKEQKRYSFIVPIGFPTPGKGYYNRPYYTSIFDSSWYDFSGKIPEFKLAMMANQATIKYHVQLAHDYFETIFKHEGITGQEEQKARIKKEYNDIDAYLKDTKNTGKSLVSFIRYTADGKELPRVKITVLENHYKGGEYLEDSEEASNIMSYAMGVHPSLMGSAPGKSKSINGTEARELFIIKQALMRPLRDRLLRPLYMVKAINKWNSRIRFQIPDTVLVTQDKEQTGKTQNVTQ